MAAATRLGPKMNLLVHLLIFSWYAFTIWTNCTLQTSDRHPGVRSYGGRWKYLTFINLVGAVLSGSINVTAVIYCNPWQVAYSCHFFLLQVLHVVFFGLCVLVDVVQSAVSVKQSRSGTPLLLTKARDFYFTAVAFPVGTVSYSVHWAVQTNLGNCLRVELHFSVYNFFNKQM